MAGDTVADIDDIGFFTPAMVVTDQLSAGEVGFIITGIKEVSALAVGDTLTTKDGWARNADLEPLPGYRDVQPVVFCGLFPIDSDEYPDLRDALEKLELNDAALSWEPEVSEALGFGFRCGFLGLLHMDIVRERLEREYDIELMATMPSVRFEVTLTDGSEVEVHIPSDFPDPGRIAEIREPMIEASILTPKEYIGPIMELCQERRGTHKGMHYLSAERVQLQYDLPLAEIVIDFFDALKSRTRGYASLDYELRGMQASNMVKLDILLAGEQVDALSMVVHRDKAYEVGRSADREAQGEDPAPAVRRPDPGGDRRLDRRARDGQGLPQGRHRRLLRRRHLAQAQAAREAEGGQEADEEGRPHRGPAGGVPRGARARRLRPRLASARRGPVASRRHDRRAQLRPRRRRPARRRPGARRRRRGARAQARDLAAARDDRRGAARSGCSPRTRSSRRSRCASARRATACEVDGDHVDADRQQEVRGVVIKREPLEVADWVAALTGAAARAGRRQRRGARGARAAGRLSMGFLDRIKGLGGGDDEDDAASSAAASRTSRGSRRGSIPLAAEQRLRELGAGDDGLHVRACRSRTSRSTQPGARSGPSARSWARRSTRSAGRTTRGPAAGARTRVLTELTHAHARLERRPRAGAAPARARRRATPAATPSST